MDEHAGKRRDFASQTSHFHSMGDLQLLAEFLEKKNSLLSLKKVIAPKSKTPIESSVFFTFHWATSEKPLIIMKKTLEKGNRNG